MYVELPSGQRNSCCRTTTEHQIIPKGCSPLGSILPIVTGSIRLPWKLPAVEMCTQPPIPHHGSMLRSPLTWNVAFNWLWMRFYIFLPCIDQWHHSILPEVSSMFWVATSSFHLFPSRSVTVPVTNWLQITILYNINSAMTNSKNSNWRALCGWKRRRSCRTAKRLLHRTTAPVAAWATLPTTLFSTQRLGHCRWSLVFFLKINENKIMFWCGWTDTQ